MQEIPRKDGDRKRAMRKDGERLTEILYWDWDSGKHGVKECTMDELGWGYDLNDAHIWIA